MDIFDERLHFATERRNVKMNISQDIFFDS